MLKTENFEIKINPLNKIYNIDQYLLNVKIIVDLVINLKTDFYINNIIKTNLVFG